MWSLAMKFPQSYVITVYETTFNLDEVDSEEAREKDGERYRSWRDAVDGPMGRLLPHVGSVTGWHIPPWKF